MALGAQESHDDRAYSVLGSWQQMRYEKQSTDDGIPPPESGAMQTMRHSFLFFLLVFLFVACGSEPFAPAPARLHSPSTAASWYRCFHLGKDDLELCIPSIGKGRSILALSSETDEQVHLKLKTQLPGSTPSVSQLSPAPREPAAEQLQKDRPNRKIYAADAYFPAFVSSNFNRNANFSGPNCYNTALIAAGALPPDAIIHVSREEFDFHLDHFFEKVATPGPLDIVTYDGATPREHVATYLSHGLIFHKKGFRKGYGYRITALSEAGKAEPFEWTPHLGDNTFGGGSAVPQDVNYQTRGFYRFKREQSHTGEPLSRQSAAMIAVTQFLRQETLTSAANWNVGKNMGTMMERLVREMLSEFSILKSSNNLAAQLAYAQLTSVSEQLFASIEETFYSSPFATPARINREACYSLNEFHRELAHRISLVYHTTALTDEEYERLVTEMARQDRERCTIPLIKMVKNILAARS
jgi:hypothetical protein